VLPRRRAGRRAPEERMAYPRVRPPRRFRRGRSMLRRALARQPWRRRPAAPGAGLPSEQPGRSAHADRHRACGADALRARREGPGRSSQERAWRRGLRAPVPAHHSDAVSEEIRIASAARMNATFQSAIPPVTVTARAVRSAPRPAANEATAMHASQSAWRRARSRWSQDLTLPFLTVALYRTAVS
jgi:hypothetical protein